MSELSLAYCACLIDVRVPRYLHHIHHKYNKEHTLSPFAGLAFHPLDGCLQAAPYVAALFVVPAHALTFELLLFATGVWTTNIHDCVDGKVCRGHSQAQRPACLHRLQRALDGRNATMSPLVL